MVLFCMLPGIEVFVVPYFGKLHVKNYHLWPDLGKNGILVLLDLLSWCVICVDWVFELVFILELTLMFINYTETGPRVIAEYFEYRLLSKMFTAGVALLWGILRVHKVEVKAHIFLHKAHAEGRLPGKAKKILRWLEAIFPGIWTISPPPASFSQVDRGTFSTSWHDRLIAWSSSATMLAGAIILRFRWQQRIDQQSYSINLAEFRVEFPEDAGENDQALWLRLMFQVPSLVVGLGWLRLLSGIFISTTSMTRNWQQLLIFTALVRSYDVSRLPFDERVELNRLLSNAPGREDVQLDLRNSVDLQTWWALRDYLVVDFQDESAIMDACGVIVACFLVILVFAALVEWFLHGSPLSLGAVLLAVPFVVLVFACFQMFDVCIKVNTVLERHMLVLADAELEGQKSAGSDAERQHACRMLRSMQRRLSVHDERQTLLGLTVTSNLRNGWIVSLLVAAFSSASQLLQPALSQLDVEKLRNVTAAELLDFLQ